MGNKLPKDQQLHIEHIAQLKKASEKQNVEKFCSDLMCYRQMLVNMYPSPKPTDDQIFECIADHLKTNNINVNFSNKEGSLLEYAYKWTENTAIILLKAGAKPHDYMLRQVYDTEASFPLFKELVRCGAKNQIVMAMYGMSPLVKKHQYNKELLKHPMYTDVNISMGPIRQFYYKQSTRGTPLWHAVKLNYEDIFDSLISVSFNVNAKGASLSIVSTPVQLMIYKHSIFKSVFKYCNKYMMWRQTKFDGMELISCVDYLQNMESLGIGLSYFSDFKNHALLCIATINECVGNQSMSTVIYDYCQ